MLAKKTPVAPRPVCIGTKRGQQQFERWAIKYLEPYFLQPDKSRTWNDHYVDTAYGPLGITIRGANVFMKFTQHPYPPRTSGMQINPHSGKYNLHLMHDWSVDLCREQFKEHLDRALLVSPEKSIGSMMIVLRKHNVAPSAISLMLAAGWLRPEVARMVIEQGVP